MSSWVHECPGVTLFPGRETALRVAGGVETTPAAGLSFRSVARNPGGWAVRDVSVPPAPPDSSLRFGMTSGCRSMKVRAHELMNP
jgi:hypothetical protein